MDVAKGISIILVAFHHSSLSNLSHELNAIMALFRIPLFFFLSGVFFSPSVKPLQFIAKKSDALLKPYFVTLIVMVIIPALFRDEKFLIIVLGVIYGTGQFVDWIWVPLWFLTHLWSIFMISYLFFSMVKPAKLSTIKKVLIIAFFLIIGSATMGRFFPIEMTLFDNEMIIRGLPFNLDISLLSTAYFLSGYFLSKFVKEFIPKNRILLISILVLLLVSIFTGAEISFYDKIYKEPFFATFGAISGIYTILSLSYYISKNYTLSNILSKFGFASLFVLIFHLPINVFFQEIFNSNSLWVIIISFLVCIILPLLIKKLIESSSILKLLYFPIK